MAIATMHASGNCCNQQLPVPTSGNTFASGVDVVSTNKSIVIVNAYKLDESVYGRKSCVVGILYVMQISRNGIPRLISYILHGSYFNSSTGI